MHIHFEMLKLFDLRWIDIKHDKTSFTRKGCSRAARSFSVESRTDGKDQVGILHREVCKPHAVSAEPADSQGIGMREKVERRPGHRDGHIQDASEFTSFFLRSGQMHAPSIND